MWKTLRRLLGFVASWPYGLPLVSHPTMPWHLSSLTLAVFCWPGAGERAIAYVAMKRAALGHALRLAKAPHLPLASGSGRRPTGLVNVLFANASCSGLAVVVAFPAVQTATPNQQLADGLPLSPARLPRAPHLPTVLLHSPRLVTSLLLAVSCLAPHPLWVVYVPTLDARIGVAIVPSRSRCWSTHWGRVNVFRRHGKKGSQTRPNSGGPTWDLSP